MHIPLMECLLDVRYWLSQLVESFAMRFSWYAPKVIVKWCFLRVFTETFDVENPEMTFVEAFKRFNRQGMD